MVAQSQPPQLLTLAQAIEAARLANPDLRAAEALAAAALARVRQAGAIPNPVLSYGREQTSGAGLTSAQNILAVEQRLELGGQRSARQAAAVARHAAAMARLTARRDQLDLETIRAYAHAVAAERRERLADQVVLAFSEAARVSEQRLAAGDVSGYAHRRIRLEAARYATLRAEAHLARRAALSTLAALVSGDLDAIPRMEFLLTDTLPHARVAAGVEPAGGTFNVAPDSLIRFALRTRQDLRALELEIVAAGADARLTAASRIPVPALSVGFKNEQLPGTPGQSNGFTAGISLPLPLWDRREGALAAATAEIARRSAEADSFRRRVVREVIEAFDALAAVVAELDVLAPQLGPESERAIRAVRVAYDEGEVTLTEWLDAVRAYQEAEASFVTLRANAMIRRAALARAAGAAPANFDRGGDPPEER
jgi:cobalt-zinc-cadmium efflux system outer membrane protein